MRCLGLSLCCLVSVLVWMGSALAAEVNKTTFPPPAGARVRVDASAPALHRQVSTVFKAGGDTLWLRSVYREAYAVPVQSIMRLEVWQGGGSRGSHAAIGAVTGTFIGVVAVAVQTAVLDANSEYQGLAVLLGASLGAIVGTTAGLFWPTGRWQDVPLPPRVSLGSSGNCRISLSLKVPIP